MQNSSTLPSPIPPVPFILSQQQYTEPSYGEYDNCRVDRYGTADHQECTTQERCNHSSTVCHIRLLLKGGDEEREGENVHS